MKACQARKDAEVKAHSGVAEAPPTSQNNLLLVEKAGRDNELDLWVSDENDAAAVASAAHAVAAVEAPAAPASTDNATVAASAESNDVQKGFETERVWLAPQAPTRPAVARVAAEINVYTMN